MGWQSWKYENEMKKPEKYSVACITTPVSTSSSEYHNRQEDIMMIPFLMIFLLLRKPNIDMMRRGVSCRRVLVIVTFLREETKLKGTFP